MTGLTAPLDDIRLKEKDIKKKKLLLLLPLKQLLKELLLIEELLLLLLPLLKALNPNIKSSAKVITRVEESTTTKRQLLC